MRIPSAQHVEGFFLGAQHMINVGRARQRHGNSYLVEALQREYTNLALVAGCPKTECRTGKAAVPLKTPKKSATLSCSKYLSRAQSQRSWRKYALAGVAGLCLFVLFVQLVARGIVIEGDWNHDRLCKYYGFEANIDARQNGRALPCP